MTASVQNIRMVPAAAAVRGVAPGRLLEASGLDPQALIAVAEISFLLGFTEVRAFRRAFERWTGSTPAAYRQACSAS